MHFGAAGASIVQVIGYVPKKHCNFQEVNSRRREFRCIFSQHNFSCLMQDSRGAVGHCWPPLGRLWDGESAERAELTHGEPGSAIILRIARAPGFSIPGLLRGSSF